MNENGSLVQRCAFSRIFLFTGYPYACTLLSPQIHVTRLNNMIVYFISSIPKFMYTTKEQKRLYRLTIIIKLFSWKMRGEKIIKQSILEEICHRLRRYKYPVLQYLPTEHKPRDGLLDVVISIIARFYYFKLRNAFIH